ncbi:HD domain-containing protein [Neobacillus notoginsengisoli]|uniref:HD domain-containing protein n=1 Tax=Neobacillus notoginsengisoli TaxID=1578198 RepID=A0A417YW70_9BACI|nr:HD-GYP domain-containing protein [Neobacillus notoginsengisoli]RHW41501.1 HD domain-containing protein [Neobacillus notoginsengisoli]
MQKPIYQSLMNEEQRTLKWFIILFYVISISFDFFYGYIMPTYMAGYKEDNSPPDLLGSWMYVFMFLLIPISIYLSKKSKLYTIKYIYFISYTLFSLIRDITAFLGHEENYRSGNPVEIFFLLMTPIFVNSRFFLVVLLGLIIKYLVAGIIIKTTNVILAIVMIAALSIFAYILLNRFQSYVNAVKTSYDQQLIGIVKGVISTLELKDPYTRGHSERVAAYALILAKEIGKFNKEELKMFNYACLLHDIGKVHIPDNILMKPTSLTKEEYEIIKSHTEVGERAVENVDGLQGSISVIRSHHERWDGKGYPDQLQGKDIPYLARITAVADAFDAMTSSRSYRDALPPEEAYKRIIEGKGTQFDPDLVEVFKEVYPSWEKVHKEWDNNPVNKFSNIHIV